MNGNLKTSTRLIQKFGTRHIVFGSICFTLILILVILMNQSSTKVKAQTNECNNSYVLNWSDTATYNVSCGSVNASQWTVSAMKCDFNSPVISLGGAVGEPDRIIDFAVRIIHICYKH